MDEEKGLRKPVGVERGGAAASTKRVPQRSEDCLSDWTLPPLLARAPVFMFSGQGAQKPGMGADLLDIPEVKGTFSCASDVLGYDVADLVLNADPDELNDTRNAQPALCVLSVGIARALMARGVQPAAVLGFSLGQVSALA
ncbi:MAG: acyltransferase domain-containing protein, partial [Eggerthella lenta]|nr:acyltransferase domain-containing protein [Eggerthella lenta]